MKSCWVCGKPVKPHTRYLDCKLCRGSIATSEKDLKRERELRDIERMMQSANTYERRGGKMKQTRHAK